MSDNPSTTRWLLPVALAVVVVAAVVVGVRARPTGIPAWQPYVDAALVAIKNLSTIDYRTIEEDRQRVYDGATREFVANTASGYRYTDKYAVQSQEITTGEPTGAGLIGMGDDVAIVLVANTKTITHGDSTEPTVLYNRNLVTIAREGDEYKLAECTAVW